MGKLLACATSAALTRTLSSIDAPTACGEVRLRPGAACGGFGAAGGTAGEAGEVMMPMRSRRALYPEDWEAIAAAVKEAAGWRCEQIGRAHV